VVSVQGVSKRFVLRKDKSLKERLVNARRGRAAREEFWALRDVDLDLRLGETVGLVGANGSGKSTLLKMVGGIIQPTSGTVTRRGRLAALLELGAGFHPDLTGRENVFLNASILGLSQAQTEKYFDPIVDFSGIERFIDTQVKFYSSGMYVRLAFAVAVHVDPDILLVDEVLAVGDEPFQRKCLDRIREFQAEGRTIVMVSHALDQVAELCDRAVVLDSGRVAADGPPLESLRVLRDDFAAVAARDAEKARHADADERGAVDAPVIHGVRLVGADGAPLDALGPGGTVCAQVDTTLPAGMREPVVGIALTTPTGQIVFGTNSQLLGTPLQAGGRRTVTIRLDHLHLGEGRYGVDAAVADDRRELTAARQTTGFAVRGDGRSIGVVAADASVLVG
jgi:ABC-2 type transport system ATP-binding protein